MPNAPSKPAMSRTVSYFAISVFSSKTMWWNFANFVVAALSLTEIVTLIPARYLPLQAALVALVNMWLRQQTQRPVALIAPGKTKTVTVKKINPGTPGKTPPTSSVEQTPPEIHD